MVIQHKKVDFVTVGGGATAAILAWKLTEAGHTIVSIEQGPGRWANPGFVHNHDSLRFGNRYAMMINLRKETWAWRPSARDPSLPMRQYGSFNPGRGLGGAMIHWSWQWWRFYPYEFRLRSHIIERYGRAKIPPGMTLKDWPLSYNEIEPYYSQVDWDLGASGDSDSPYGPPRSRPFPNPPLAYNIPAFMFTEACEALGYHPFGFSSGISSRAWTDRFGNVRGGCLYCGFCTRYGCEVDAKASPQTTYLPVALKTGRYEVRTLSKVLHVNLSRDGLATGVTYVDERTGEEHFQPADVVLLTAFTFENVRMLLLSRGGSHPDGIGNDRGQVGKNYTYQIFRDDWTGIFPGRHFKLYAGNSSNRAVIHDFYGDNFDHSDLDFIGGAQIWSTPGERHPDATASDYPYGEGKKWGWDWKNSLRNWDATAGLAAEGDSLPYERNFLDLDPVYKDAWGRPLLRLTFDWTENEQKLYAFIADNCIKILNQMGPEITDVSRELGPCTIGEYQSTHPTGGAIMGSSPEDSVTNRHGQVWDTPNVFVTGAALFPQNSGANPTATVAALAYMQGDAIRDRYFKNEGRLMA
jgi:gluconate 2-dehydrogenase alpha chain